MFTALFLVISLLGSIAPGIATAQDAGTPAPEVTGEPAAEPPAVDQPAEAAPVEQPAQESAPSVEQPAAEQPAAEQPAEEAAPVEQPVDDTSTVMTEVAPEPVEVAAAPVSCQVAEGVAPWIASDLADYPPGAWVTLYGGDWVPGQTVEIFVDDDGMADAALGEWSHFATVTADGSGAFVYGFSLPDVYVANYAVTATGECSSAATSFTDGNFQVQVAGGPTGSYSFSWTRYEKVGSQQASCTSGLTTNGSTNVGISAQYLAGAGNNDYMVVRAPAIEGYVFTGWSNGSATYSNNPNCFQGSGNAQTWVANYKPKTEQTISFGGLTNKAYGDAAFTLSATATSNLPVTFAAKAGSSCSVSGISVTLTGAGNCTIVASQAGNDSYNAATSVERTFAIAPKALTINGLSASNKSYDGTSEATISGSPSLVGVVGSDAVSVSGSPVGTFDSASAGNGKTVTVTGLSLTGAAAGNYVLTPLTLTADVTAAKVTVTANDQTITFGEQVPPLTFTSRPELPAGNFDGALAVEVGFTGNAGEYDIAQGTLKLVNPNYTLDFRPGILKVKKASQAISGISVPEEPTVDGTYKPSATGGGSGNAVTFGASGACSFADGTVTFDAAGACVITADQAGNDNYNAAPKVEQSFTIGKGTATIELGNLTQTYDGKPKFATATPSKDLVVTVLYAQGENAVEEPVNAGEYTVTATIMDANYEGSVTGTLRIEPASQEITFAPLDDKTYGDDSFDVSATATSGLTVSFALADGSTGCSISEATVSITGAGTCAITASQAGNGNYRAAEPVTRSLTIARANQATIEITDPSTAFYGADITPSTTGGSGDGAVTFTVTSNSTACEIADDRVKITSGTGTCEVVATKAADGNYNEAVSAPFAITLEKADQAALAIDGPLSGIYGDILDLNTTGGSGDGDVTFESSGPACSIDAEGRLKIASGTGACSVTATKAADANYKAQVSEAVSVTVTKKTVEFSVIDPNPAYNGLVKAASVESVPDGVQVEFTYAQDGEPVAEPINAGTYDVTATITDENHQGSAKGTLTIGKANQAISFGKIDGRTYGDAPFQVSASSDSALPVSFLVEGNCSLGGENKDIVTITGAGACTVTASQKGDGNYEAAKSVDQSFDVAKADQATLTITGPETATYGTSVTPTTSGGSGTGTVTFAVTSDSTACEIDGGNAKVASGSGTCKVVATQAADDNYNEAVSEPYTLKVEKAKATLAFVADDLAQTYGATRAVAVTTNPMGISVVSVTYDDSRTVPTNAGTHTVKATLDNANYDAEEITDTLTIGKADQTITFGAAPTGLKVGDSHTPSASGGDSGKPVTLGASGSCVIEGSGVKMTAVGTCTVTADQEGNDNYKAAQQATQKFEVQAAITREITAINQPLDMMPTVNTTKGGSTIPVKFTVVDENKKQVTATDGITVSMQQVSCKTYEAGQTDLVEVTTSTGNTTLRHDGAQYIQNWKTPATSNTCYRVTITVADPVSKVVLDSESVIVQTKK